MTCQLAVWTPKARKAVSALMAACRKSMGYEELKLVHRPVVAQPSVTERLTAYRKQLATEPKAGVWSLPLIEKLEAQVGRNAPKEPRGLAKRAAKTF
ncbi:hypothetical protein [Acetobacter indonesiensis]|uniref:hypothetical protein n=1 Tax=Acetobacter indonesiensis TaxID=104101 RepID=UPI0039BFF336